ncbi:hypothetical protein ACFLR4_00180 [Bacteroidota bacterium]
MKKMFLMIAIAAFIFSGCSENINEPATGNGDLQSNSQMLKQGASSGGETTYSCADGELVGYEGECPSVGVYEYTLWAGKYNDAGTVSIWADDANIYVEYNTNETADLEEAHVYVWTNLNDIPDKRPSPGQAPYKAENINADSYTFMIPASEFGIDDLCGSTLYISTHAALIGNNTSNDELGSGDNSGETAYGGGPNSPDCFDAQKGAWWGYVNFTVECFYEVSGTLYEDANNNGSFDEGEKVFPDLTVTAGSETATTAADGSYSFMLPAGESFTITSEIPAGDYLANENAGGYSTGALSDCLEGVNFGFVPLYDITVDLNLTVTGDCVPGVVVTINGDEIIPASGNYVLENQLPADEYVVVVTATSGDEVVSETQTISSLNADTTLTFNMSFTCPDGDDENDFPTWGQDISHVILVFTGASDPSSNNGGDDGYYTIKIDEYQDEDPDDLDDDIDAYLAALVAGGYLVDGQYELMGSSIKGGLQTTSYYSYGSFNTNGDAPDTPPAGLGFIYPGGSANESPQSAVDVVIDRSNLLP